MRDPRSALLTPSTEQSVPRFTRQGEPPGLSRSGRDLFAWCDLVNDPLQETAGPTFTTADVSGSKR